MYHPPPLVQTLIESIIMNSYVQESFTPDEQDILRRYFTNLQGPVFALVNLPEVVKGALFARYSRSPKSLRRLFLDEFVDELDISGDHEIDATVGLKRAEKLYEKVFNEYGDDSVAQLGGVHLACEQASNLLTKVLERGRLMSYLEQSTRYISYDARLQNGHYRYHREPSILDSPLGARYIGDMDRMFDTYAELNAPMSSYLSTLFPLSSGDSELAWKRSIRAQALDALRGLLPAASISNVGLYGSGQSYEALILRMRSHELDEARQYGELILQELRKVIPSFLTRLDRPERGGKWLQYLVDKQISIKETTSKLLKIESVEPSPTVQLIQWDPEAENKLLAAAIFSQVDISETQIDKIVSKMSTEEKLSILKAYEGERTNRRHRPGRALEQSFYKFEILSDYGSFRDLQRHRMLSIEWQPLGIEHGFILPQVVVDAGLGSQFEHSIERSISLYNLLRKELGQDKAQYSVALAFKIRYSITMNAREAMHLLELRSSSQGHPLYREIAQQMHQQIQTVAGHKVIGEMMRFVDHSQNFLARLKAEELAIAKTRK